MLVGQGHVLSGAAVMPITPEAPTNRKSVIYAQKGVSLRLPEATALVDAVMDGRVHKDYVYVGGHQYLITTVMETSYYGRCTSTATTGGIVLVKTDSLLLLATYTEPVTGAEAIPFVHKWVAHTPAPPHSH